MEHIFTSIHHIFYASIMAFMIFECIWLVMSEHFFFFFLFRLISSIFTIIAFSGNEKKNNNFIAILHREKRELQSATTTELIVQRLSICDIRNFYDICRYNRIECSFPFPNKKKKRKKKSNCIFFTN